jgi:hypothetical protein
MYSLFNFLELQVGYSVSLVGRRKKFAVSNPRLRDKRDLLNIQIPHYSRSQDNSNICV